MKIAIHHRNNSFSERWIAYCENNKIEYKLVNAFASDIIDQTKNCDVFMWHFHHAQFKDILTAKRILFALEQAGVKVFPNFNTGWHFDDKVAQKYLLEAIKAPLVPSYVFYDKNEAKQWASIIDYPKVFKLKGGAGSKNVLLVKSKKQCYKLINKAFGKGFTQSHRSNLIKDDLLRFKKSRNPINLLKIPARYFIKSKFAKSQHKEKGYIYFQEFIPNNDSDIRVIIVADKAFALKRMVRENDFRASGSGNIIYDKKQIDIRCIKVSFEVNRKIESQSIAFDYVFDKENNPLIVEISYGFSMSAYDVCPGYWTSDLQWHEEKFNPQAWMIEQIIEELN